MAKKINSYSQEAIKARMLQNAVKIWGLESTRSIDPFVKLLIDAFSAEIFKVSNEINSINGRILEKLARMLTPTLYTTPQPAHAIATTYPLESIETLPDHSEFFIKKQFSSSLKTVADIHINIPFTPVDNVWLVKMRAAIVFAGNTCYGIKNDFEKDVIAKIPPDILFGRKIILGIDATAYHNDVLPSVLSFYCANPTFEHVDFVYKLLPFASVKSCGVELKANPGLTYTSINAASGYKEIFNEYAIQTQIKKNIKEIYKEKFIEISGLNNDMIREGLPDSLHLIQHNEPIANFLSGKRMIWLEMEFPPQFTPAILENFSFTLNAFPVYNRGWKRNECTLDIMGNNVPLQTDTGEYFLYVEEVIDSFGNEYTEIPYTYSEDNVQKGIYAIRTGGMERFDERNAADMIAHVLELTRDEVSAFGVFDRDKVVAALSTMTQQMKILNQKVETTGKNVKQEMNYVIINPIGQTEYVRATYWVTHSSWANNIKPGTELVQEKLPQASYTRNIMLLTESIGGNEEQKGTDAIQAYKYALTARDKIISMEDAKNYCRLALKNNIKQIEVRRGTIISDKPKEGFIRTIEIEIVPVFYSLYGKTYWDNQAAALKKQIVARAIDGIEYIVNIINKDDE
ncbi:MAG: type VI secretion system baseplate subunit TssF [Chitinophagaceae bacterium]|jgi:hypothetical protein|nr:type VI secretion system baseplate subunit TssF [Chitinophagaceae bacterium]